MKNFFNFLAASLGLFLIGLGSVLTINYFADKDPKIVIEASAPPVGEVAPAYSEEPKKNQKGVIRFIDDLVLIDSAVMSSLLTGFFDEDYLGFLELKGIIENKTVVISHSFIYTDDRIIFSESNEENAIFLCDFLDDRIKIKKFFGIDVQDLILESSQIKSKNPIQITDTDFKNKELAIESFIFSQNNLYYWEFEEETKYIQERTLELFYLE